MGATVTMNAGRMVWTKRPTHWYCTSAFDEHSMYVIRKVEGGGYIVMHKRDSMVARPIGFAPEYLRDAKKLADVHHHKLIMGRSETDGLKQYIMRYPIFQVGDKVTIRHRLYSGRIATVSYVGKWAYDVTFEQGLTTAFQLHDLEVVL